jgi:hypothetical protein
MVRLDSVPQALSPIVLSQSHMDPRHEIVTGTAVQVSAWSIAHAPSSIGDANCGSASNLASQSQSQSQSCTHRGERTQNCTVPMTSECVHGCASASRAVEHDRAVSLEPRGMGTAARRFSRKSSASLARRPSSRNIIQPTHPIKPDRQSSAGLRYGVRSRLSLFAPDPAARSEKRGARSEPGRETWAGGEAEI